MFHLWSGLQYLRNDGNSPHLFRGATESRFFCQSCSLTRKNPITPKSIPQYYTKVSIYAIWKEIGNCLDMKQKVLAEYIINETNLGNNRNTVRKYL